MMMAGTIRKKELKAMFSGGTEPLPADLETKSATDGGDAATERMPSGAVKAMGLTLSAISRDAEETQSLRRALEQGDRVVALDPALVDVSFIGDRLVIDGQDDLDLVALVASIRENGQQLPILVRPHPDMPGRYQAAYGHRRLKATQQLGIPVQAIVRALTDDALVMAQGKENAERRNLSFIERALFARTLIERGFERKVVCDALAVVKSELSRMLQVVNGIHEDYIRLIGPAPKIGRARWMTLVKLMEIKTNQIRFTEETGFRRFHAAATDERFNLVFTRLFNAHRPDPLAPVALTDADGTVFARLKHGKTARIEFAADMDPDFLDSAARLLAEHYASFVAARSSDDGVPT